MADRVRTAGPCRVLEAGGLREGGLIRARTVSRHHAAVTLERLRLTLTNAADASPGTVTVSIGGVTFIAVPGDMEEMIQQADSRMYEAKAAGKNRVRLDVAGSA